MIRQICSLCSFCESELPGHKKCNMFVISWTLQMIDTEDYVVFQLRANQKSLNHGKKMVYSGRKPPKHAASRFKQILTIIF